MKISRYTVAIHAEHINYTAIYTVYSVEYSQYIRNRWKALLESSLLRHKSS